MTDAIIYDRNTWNIVGHYNKVVTRAAAIDQEAENPPHIINIFNTEEDKQQREAEEAFNEDIERRIGDDKVNPEQNMTKPDGNIGKRKRGGMGRREDMRGEQGVNLPGRSGSRDKLHGGQFSKSQNNVTDSLRWSMSKTRKKSKSKSSQLRKTIKKRRVKKIKRKSLRRRKPIKKQVSEFISYRFLDNIIEFGHHNPMLGLTMNRMSVFTNNTLQSRRQHSR